MKINKAFVFLNLFFTGISILAMNENIHPLDTKKQAKISANLDLFHQNEYQILLQNYKLLMSPNNLNNWKALLLLAEEFKNLAQKTQIINEERYHKCLEHIRELQSMGLQIKTNNT